MSSQIEAPPASDHAVDKALGFQMILLFSVEGRTDDLQLVFTCLH